MARRRKGETRNRSLGELLALRRALADAVKTVDNNLEEAGYSSYLNPPVDLSKAAQLPDLSSLNGQRIDGLKDDTITVTGKFDGPLRTMTIGGGNRHPETEWCAGAGCKPVPRRMLTHFARSEHDESSTCHSLGCVPK